MLRNNRLRSALVTLAGLAALTTAACSDRTGSPVGPGITSAATDHGLFARRARGVIVTDLQLSSNTVILGGAATQYTVTFRNLTESDYEGVFVQGILEAAGKRDWIQGPAHLVACPFATATLPAGSTCTMTADIATGTNLPTGPGTFTIKVEQLLPSGNRKLLDSRTVDVLIAQEVDRR